MSIKRSGVKALLLGALLLFAWLSAPHLAGFLLLSYLKSLDLHNVVVEVESVGSQQLRIRRLSFVLPARNHGYVDVHGIDLSFSFAELAHGKIQSLSIHKASVDIRTAHASSEADVRQVIVLLSRPWHQEWPFNVVSVGKLTLHGPSSVRPQRLSLQLTRAPTKLTGQMSLWQTTGRRRHIAFSFIGPGQLRASFHGVASSTAPPMTMDVDVEERGSSRRLWARVEADLEPLSQWFAPWLGTDTFTTILGGRAEIEAVFSQSGELGAEEAPWKGSVTGRADDLVVGSSDDREEVQQAGESLRRATTSPAAIKGGGGMDSSAPGPRQVLHIAAATFELHAIATRGTRRRNAEIAFRADGHLRSLKAQSVTLDNGTFHGSGTLVMQDGGTELIINPEAIATLETLTYSSVHVPWTRVVATGQTTSQRIRLGGLPQGFRISLPTHWQIALPRLITDRFRLELDSAELALLDTDRGSASRSSPLSGGITASKLVFQMGDLVLPSQQGHLDFILDGNTSRGRFGLSLAEGAAQLQGALSEASEEGGHIAFDLNFDYGEEKVPLSRILRNWPYAFDLVTGRLALSGELSWPQQPAQQVDGGMTATLHIRLLETGGFYRAVWFSGLDTDLVLRLAPSIRTAHSAPIRADIIDFGLPLRNVELRLALLPEANSAWPRLVVYDLKAALLGGALQSRRIVVDGKGSEHRIPLRLSQVDLANLLSIYPFSGLQATGRLDGEMDLKAGRGGISVKDGTFWATPPGGRIRYRPKASAAKVEAAVPGSAALFRALEDFHYEVLSAKADYAMDGKLLLKLHLEGNSPRLHAGRPVHVNLNLDQNVLSLLRSLRLVNGLNERLDSRVRSHYEKLKTLSHKGNNASP